MFLCSGSSSRELPLTLVTVRILNNLRSLNEGRGVFPFCIWENLFYGFSGGGLGVCDAASAIDGGIAEGKSRGGCGGSGGGDGPVKNMA